MEEEVLAQEPPKYCPLPPEAKSPSERCCLPDCIMIVHVVNLFSDLGERLPC